MMRVKSIPIFWVVTSLVLASAVVLGALKTSGAVAISWWLVLAPVFIYTAVLIIASLASLMTVVALVKILEEREKEEEDYFNGY